MIGREKWRAFRLVSWSSSRGESSNRIADQGGEVLLERPWDGHRTGFLEISKLWKNRGRMWKGIVTGRMTRQILLSAEG
eukprot:scaffold1247_cov251-Pinguiococcus_pyrenoidosus.AAC.15